MGGSSSPSARWSPTSADEDPPEVWRTAQRLLAALDRLPLPSTEAVRDAMREMARSRRSLRVEELDEQVAARLGLALDDPVVELLLDRVSDELIGADGPLEMLSGDRVVHVGTVLDGVVLTHRLSQAERDLEVLPVDVDLAGFRRRTALTTAEGDSLTVTGGQWGGPAVCWRDSPPVMCSPYASLTTWRC